jgi:hypothetical protein
MKYTHPFHVLGISNAALYNVLSSFAIDFTIVHCIYIFKCISNVIRWRSPTLRYLVSVYILVPE